jgi:hypothetical protein
MAERDPLPDLGRGWLEIVGISRTASFSRVLAREDPRQPYACARNLALKSPLMAARHRSCPSEKSGAYRPSHSLSFDHHRLSAYLDRDR